MSARTRDYPQTEFPTRAEADADARTGTDAWFPTGPAGSALAALLGPATGAREVIDISQH